MKNISRIEGAWWVRFTINMDGRSFNDQHKSFRDSVYDGKANALLEAQCWRDKIRHAIGPSTRSYKTRPSRALTASQTGLMRGVHREARAIKGKDYHYITACWQEGEGITRHYRNKKFRYDPSCKVSEAEAAAKAITLRREKERENYE